MGTVVGSWRLRYMIVLFLFLTSIYVSYVFLGNVNSEVDEEISFENDVEQVTYNDTETALSQSNDFINFFDGLIGFITFDMIDNFYIRLFFNIVMSIVYLSIGYIVYTYIKEWIPLV